ncbi:hypothetical protein ABK040_008161 [Willaertia magna]
MSTVSTKYLPFDKRPDLIRNLKSEDKIAEFPTINVPVENFKSSVSLGAVERTPNHELYLTVKKEHIDKTGENLMENSSSRLLEQMYELEQRRYLTNDLSGVHFELGSEDNNRLKTIQQESYSPQDKIHYIDNKLNIIKKGEGQSVMGNSSVFHPSKESYDWGNTITTTFKSSYNSPSDQAKNNLSLGKDPIPRRNPLQKDVQESLNESLRNPLQQNSVTNFIVQENKEEANRIVKDMRSAHFSFGNVVNSDGYETEFKRNYYKKEKARENSVLDSEMRTKSDVVLGYDKDEDYEYKYLSNYSENIERSSTEIAKTVTVQYRKGEVDRRNEMSNSMRGSSVVFGNEPTSLVTETKHEFRNVKFK